MMSPGDPVAGDRPASCPPKATNPVTGAGSFFSDVPHFLPLFCCSWNCLNFSSASEPIFFFLSISPLSPPHAERSTGSMRKRLPITIFLANDMHKLLSEFQHRLRVRIRRQVLLGYVVFRFGDRREAGTEKLSASTPRYDRYALNFTNRKS